MSSFLSSIQRCLASGLFCLVVGQASLAAPQVVVTIQPVHALVASIMEGVSTPTLLLNGSQSPHTYQMRPSDARALANCDVLFWMGPALETFLQPTVTGLSRAARAERLLDSPGLSVMPYRLHNIWMNNEAHEHAHAHGEESSPDPHVWLDPDNAAVIARQIQKTLIEVDPANKTLYETNGARLTQRLATLDAQLQQQLLPVLQEPLIVFHDAYQYFQRHFSLRILGAVTLTPDRQTSARQLRELRQVILSNRVRCLFVEPQFPRTIADSLRADTGIKVAQLDPIGIRIAAGPNAYVELMQSNVAAIVSCLTENNSPR